MKREHDNDDKDADYVDNHSRNKPPVLFPFEFVTLYAFNRCVYSDRVDQTKNGCQSLHINQNLNEFDIWGLRKFLVYCRDKGNESQSKC